MITRALETGAILALGIAAVGCHQASSRPDPRLTPGAVASHSTAEVCERGYARAHRVWGSHEKYSVTLPRYGIPARDGHLFEDDDLIPICAGGDNANPRNHWPQSCDAWHGPECVSGSAHDKDLEEARFCRAVCDGSITLDQAQDHFRHWGE